MANERLDRFTKLLKEIFELDKSDLDFGIYRVMNLRKERIEEFLEQQLPQIVQETLAPFAQDGKEKLRARMAKMEKDAAEMGMTMDQLPETAPVRKEYMQCQKQLAEGADLAALETDVYAALYSFFNRYYEEGDFISKRRYKEGVYASPMKAKRSSCIGPTRISIISRPARALRTTPLPLTELQFISAWQMQPRNRTIIRRARRINVSLCSSRRTMRPIPALKHLSMI